MNGVAILCIDFAIVGVGVAVIAGLPVGVEQGFKAESLRRLYGGEPISSKVPDNLSRFVYFFLRIRYGYGRNRRSVLFGRRLYRSNHFGGNPRPRPVVH